MVGIPLFGSYPITLTIDFYNLICNNFRYPSDAQNGVKFKRNIVFDIVDNLKIDFLVLTEVSTFISILHFMSYTP